MKPLRECYLYTFVDTAYLHDRKPEDVAKQLCEGGSDLIQLRAKNSTPEEICALAQSLLPITETAGVGLVINDYPGIALQIGAPFCHLGQEDFFDGGYTHTSHLAARKPPLKLGLSTHAPDQAERALRADPDYIAVGPVFATGTKPGARPATLGYVRWAAEHVKIPWFAIGGIDLHNLDDVLAAGARRVCVLSAILNAPDIAQACRAFKERLISAR
jgi:thiamine-phosphate pyrophosphorylase